MTATVVHICTVMGLLLLMLFFMWCNQKVVASKDVEDSLEGPMPEMDVP